MKISTKGRYGLRLMLDLAVHSGGGLVPLRDIAARQEISEKYLEQIMMLLNRAGLVRSVRGSQGGYALSRPAGEITVGDVLRTMEGSLAPVDCVAEGAAGCAMAGRCVTTEVWAKLKEAVDGVVDGITLADLADRYHAKNPPDYCI
ncbi:MAG TPA: Rrf2 family transcriptional regulator [Firmicutes bacterium]|nr:Rrf2 family transcriptional regulator [Bacillota bacterium]